MYTCWASHLKHEDAHANQEKACVYLPYLDDKTADYLQPGAAIAPGGRGTGVRVRRGASTKPYAAAFPDRMRWVQPLPTARPRLVSRVDGPHATVN